MKVMIYSNEHRMWWGSDYCGYVWYQEEAGVFDYEEAHRKYPRIDFNTAGEDFFIVISKDNTEE